MQISNKYLVVERIEKEEKEGFATVDVVDDSVYKGRVVFVPEAPIYMGNKQVDVGDTIIFAKYSPDTHDVELEGGKLKFVAVSDVLAVI
jgi:co-chaperonin GroES (HSP10)